MQENLHMIFTYLCIEEFENYTFSFFDDNIVIVAGEAP